MVKKEEPQLIKKIFYNGSENYYTQNEKCAISTSDLSGNIIGIITVLNEQLDIIEKAGYYNAELEIKSDNREGYRQEYLVITAERFETVKEMKNRIKHNKKNKAKQRKEAERVEALKNKERAKIIAAYEEGKKNE